MIGVVPTFLYGLYNTVDVYFNRPPDTSGREAARRSLLKTWSVGRYLWPALPVGMVVYLLGVMAGAPVKRRR